MTWQRSSLRPSSSRPSSGNDMHQWHTPDTVTKPAFYGPPWSPPFHSLQLWPPLVNSTQVHFLLFRNLQSSCPYNRFSCSFLTIPYPLETLQWRTNLDTYNSNKYLGVAKHTTDGVPVLIKKSGQFLNHFDSLLLSFSVSRSFK